MAGLTATGFDTKTTDEIVEEMNDDLKSELGNVNTQGDSVLGVMTAAVAGRLGGLWELGLALYRAFDSAQSTDDALDGLSELTGTIREEAAPSTTVAAVDMDAGQVLAQGSQASVEDAPARVFETDAATTTETFRRWHEAEMTATEDGVTVAEEGTLNQIDTPSAGWNAIVNEPVPGTRWSGVEPFALINGMTLTLNVLGAGDQTVTFNTGDFVDIGNATAQEVADDINAETTLMTASDEGGRTKIEADTAGSAQRLQVRGGTSTTALGLPVGTATGVDGVEADLGNLDEDNTELRNRRGEDLERQGTGTSDSLRAQLLDDDNFASGGNTDVSVYQNRTDIVDGDGLAPHSFRPVILGAGPTDAEIAQVIFDNSPLGIESQGGETANITDSQGTVVPIYWDLATPIPIYIEATISAIEDDYAGDTAVEDALLAYAVALLMNDDVISEFAKAQLFVAGVRDITAWLIDDVTPPVTDVNIPIDLNEVATLDRGDIDLTVNFVVPT